MTNCINLEFLLVFILAWTLFVYFVGVWAGYENWKRNSKEGIEKKIKLYQGAIKGLRKRLKKSVR